MKVIKDFICMSFVLMLIITGCYEDKGSYNYSEWTGIDSVTGVEIPGSSYGRISLSEGELLEIDPKITFKEGTNPNDLIVFQKVCKFRIDYFCNAIFKNE